MYLKNLYQVKSIHFKYIFFGNIILLLLLLIFTDRHQKIDIRDAIFSEEISTSFFKQSLDEVNQKYDFFSDGQVMSEYRLKNFIQQKLINNRDFKNAPTYEKVKNIILEFSSAGTKGGCGFYSSDLIKNIEWVIAGHGCCSDHSQVFIAIASFYGVRVREVHNLKHTLNEYWDESLRKWVVIDPMYALMFKNRDGEYLSLVEVHEQLKSGETLNPDFFGKKTHLIAQKENRVFEDLYLPENFSVLRVTLGSNVFKEDVWNSKFDFLPKSISQLVLFFFKIKPLQGYLIDLISLRKNDIPLNNYIWGFRVYMISNFAFLFWWAWGIILTSIRRA